MRLNNEMFTLKRVLIKTFYAFIGISMFRDT